MIMKVLIFDVIGRMAHFRRFYSSVTALSYYFPPRNTVMGMIAAIMGYDRDSYYDNLSRDKIGIALAIRTKMRRLILPTNYLDTDQISEDRLRGKGKVPTTIEYILPFLDKELSYRIFICGLDNTTILDELKYRIQNCLYVYPLSLGAANCLARAEYVYAGESKIVDNREERPISTVIPIDCIENNGLKINKDRRIILEERLPPDLGPRRSIIGNSRNYIFEENGKDINVITKPDYTFKVDMGGEVIYGIFM